MSATVSLAAIPSSSTSSDDLRCTSSSETHTCPYKDCNKSFSKKYNLKAHLRLHTGEQPFECDRPDCKKKFKWRSSLSSHSIWHTRKDSGSINSQDCKLATSRNQPRHKSSEPANNVQHSAQANPTQVAKCAAGQVSRKSDKIIKRSTRRVSSKSESDIVKVSANVAKKKRPRKDQLLQNGRNAPTADDSLPVSVGSSQAESLSRSSELSLGEQILPGPVFSYLPGDESRSSRSVTKKRKTEYRARGASLDTESARHGGSDTTSEEYGGTSPGSPVTSDSGLSEDSLDLDIFTCDMLPPLIGGHGDVLGLESGDVGVILEDAGGSDDIFGFSSPSGEVLHELDTRFGPFELENIQGFCLSKSDGL